MVALLVQLLVTVVGVLVAPPDASAASTGTASLPALPSSSVQTHYNLTSGGPSGSGGVPTTPSYGGDLDGCNCVCGVARRTRIVGGEAAGASEFPWLAALSRKGTFYCGGALVSRRHVLTAAHCMYGMVPKDVSVTLGSHNRTNRLTPGRSHHRLRKVMVHEKFDVSTFNNDIAILELDREVDIDSENAAARTVCLPAEEERDYTGMLGTVAGWGRTAERKPVSDVLRKVVVPLMSKNECDQAGYSKGRITENMVCAGYTQGVKDACQGDSGGPLLLPAETGSSSEVIGIVSWGRGCARPNFPGVYTRVHKFLPWIHTKLGTTCTCQPAQ